MTLCDGTLRSLRSGAPCPLRRSPAKPEPARDRHVASGQHIFPPPGRMGPQCTTTPGRIGPTAFLPKLALPIAPAAHSTVASISGTEEEEEEGGGEHGGEGCCSTPAQDAEEVKASQENEIATSELCFDSGAASFHGSGGEDLVERVKERVEGADVLRHQRAVRRDA